MIRGWMEWLMTVLQSDDEVLICTRCARRFGNPSSGVEAHQDCPGCVEGELLPDPTVTVEQLMAKERSELAA